ncbi:hypothetical protein BS78_03G172400 [Paspalum vaginatum]|nr:hypothetical protein BS78_03G172400 [Paspalum vaginatum]
MAFLSCMAAASQSASQASASDLEIDSTQPKKSFDKSKAPRATQPLVEQAYGEERRHGLCASHPLPWLHHRSLYLKTRWHDTIVRAGRRREGYTSRIREMRFLCFSMKSYEPNEP